eukprot:jgi/Galph1/3367/GphlegSOOS_G2026.1
MAQVITCKAAVAWEPGKPLSVEEIQVDPPKAHEVRIRICATSICHTDAYTLSGKDPEGKFPCILGHEGSGIVESVGSGVESVKPGDPVVPLYTPECGNCEYCRSPITNLCPAIRGTQGKGLMPDGTVRFHCKGRDLFHYMGTSTFSEYTVVAEISVVKINDAVAFERACLFGCGLTTGIGAVLNTCRVEKGKTVAVFGLGAVGLSVIQGAKLAGASRIIGVDINEKKFELAKKLGATDCVNPNSYDKPIQEVLINLTNGGLDYTFEAVGNVKLMTAALESCHRGWGVSCIIGVAAAGEQISTRPFQLVTGRTWKGSAFGGVKGRSQLNSFIERYRRGEIEVEPFVSGEVSFEKINEAFDALHRGETIRTILKY